MFTNNRSQLIETLNFRNFKHKYSLFSYFCYYRMREGSLTNMCFFEHAVILDLAEYSTKDR